MDKKYLLSLLSNEKVLLLSGILIITIFFLPYVFCGEDIPVPIFDNLDSNVVWAKMVLDQGGIFLPPGATVHQMMNGIPHSSVYGTYDISLVWFQLFGMFWGYVFNKYLMALIGFLGMYFLLRKHFLPKDTSLYIPIVVSIFFGLLPFWSYMATVSGVPVALLAFLNIRKGNIHFGNWLLLLVYGFYSSAVLTGFFLLLLMAFLFVFDWIREKKFNTYFFLSMVFLSLMYVISHLPLFYSFFYDPDYVSHRSLFHTYGVDMGEVMKSMGQIFIGSDWNGHAISLQLFMLIPIIFALVIMLKKKEVNKLYSGVLIFLLLTGIFYGVYESDKIARIINAMNRIFPIDMRRFYWLHPIAWSVAFAMSLYYINKTIKWGRWFVSVTLLIQLGYVIKEQPYFQNHSDPTYQKFYAEEQFRDISAFIGKEPSSYRVLSVWLHPAITLYNGFYTLDGFSANYPLSYKLKFRKIIEKELDKTWNVFFDTWGSRCYAYTSECGSNDIIYDNHLPEIQHLQFNYDLIKEMGGQYILSAVEINTENNPNLKLLKVFDNYKTSHWTVYLYEVI